MSQDISFHDKTALLVEDELFLAEKIGQQLTALGLKDVLTATTLDDAMRLVEIETVDIALLDVNLPENQTTFGLGERLSSEGIPVVFFSGFNVDEMSRISSGYEFLEKPISVPRLKAALHRAILRAPALASSQNQGGATGEGVTRPG